jgi:hypothetical protein
MNRETIKLLNNFDDDIIELDLSNKNISGILDLKRFELLEKLICSKNKITEIINLSENLIYFDCSYNLIEKISNINKNLEYFNCKVNPLKYLVYPFNILPNKYPKSLNYLEFNYEFNMKIKKLPENLEVLNFNPFDQDNYFNKIEFNHAFDFFPNSIKEFRYNGFIFFKQHNHGNITESINLLDLTNLKNINNFLEHIDEEGEQLIPYFVNKIVLENSSIKFNLISNITRLEINVYDCPITYIPDTITHLIIKSFDPKKIDFFSKLPKSLVYLKIGNKKFTESNLENIIWKFIFDYSDQYAIFKSDDSYYLMLFDTILSFDNFNTFETFEEFINHDSNLELLFVNVDKIKNIDKNTIDTDSIKYIEINNIVDAPTVYNFNFVKVSSLEFEELDNWRKKSDWGIKIFYQEFYYGEVPCFDYLYVENYISDRLLNSLEVSKYLEFGDNFNQEIDNFDCVYSKYLKFGDNFNSKLDCYPRYLEYLSLGQSYNYSFDNYPKKLKYLQVGEIYNKILQDYPESLKYIIKKLNCGTILKYEINDYNIKALKKYDFTLDKNNNSIVALEPDPFDLKNFILIL